MGTTIHRTDIVRETKDVVGVGIDAPLQCGFNLNPIFLGVHINDVGMQSILLRIHVGDVFLDAAFVVINLLVSFTLRIACRGALIAENDFDPTIEVGELP